MAVTGWTAQSARAWNGTEATTITPEQSGTTGFLTRDVNDGIGDFTFIATISQLTDRDINPGWLFGFQSTTQYYFLRRRTGYTSYLYLNKDSLSASGNLASNTVGGGVGSSTFSIKIEKSGSNIQVYLDEAAGTNWGTAVFNITDASYSTGKIGFAVPITYENGGTFTFGSITAPSTARRRINIT